MAFVKDLCHVKGHNDWFGSLSQYVDKNLHWHVAALGYGKIMLVTHLKRPTGPLATPNIDNNLVRNNQRVSNTSIGSI